MAHAMTHEALDRSSRSSSADHQPRPSTQEDLAVGAVLGAVLVLLGATYAMYTLRRQDLSKARSAPRAWRRSCRSMTKALRS